MRKPLAAILAIALLVSPAMAKHHRRKPQPVAPVPPPTPRTPSAFDARDEVFYHIMPIAWRYGESRAELPAVAREYRFGNFTGLTESLGYLKSLGVTGVWLNPIFPSPAYHGYQHGPADRVNPWFGEEAEFWDFVNAARGHGIKVYLDLVVYGISQSSEYFTDSKGSPLSRFAPYLAFTNQEKTKFTGYSFTTWNGDTVGFVNWDLRHAPARDLVIGWSKHWLDPNGDGDPSDGVAGFRLDHVWRRYDKGPEGLGYNIDDFWKAWRAELEKVNPKVFTFAEQSRWETHGVDLLCTSDGQNAHDAAFTKPFEVAAREALKTETAKPLYDAMAATVKACPNGRTFLGIIGDHDVDRLASAIGADGPERAGRAKAAAAVLLLQPFPPVLYFGDELGMLGKAGNFKSDANDIPRREPMKWTAVAGPAMSNYGAVHKGAYAARYSKDQDGRSVEEQSGKPDSVLETYRTLIALRRESPLLRRGEYVALACDHAGVWAFERRLTGPAGGKAMRVAINLTGKKVSALIEGAQRVELEPYGYGLKMLHEDE